MKKNLSIIIGIIIVVIGIILLVSSGNSGVTIEKDSSESSFMERLSVQHSFKNNKHTIHGVIAAPTPCHKLGVTSKNIENDVLIDITLTEGENVCTEVITNQPFFYSFEAAEDANLLATYNGEGVQLNIVEIEEGEKFDLADFMFKG